MYRKLKGVAQDSHLNHLCTKFRMKDYRNPRFFKLQKNNNNFESIWDHIPLTQAYMNMFLIDQIVSPIEKQLRTKSAVAYYPLKT